MSSGSSSSSSSRAAAAAAAAAALQEQQQATAAATLGMLRAAYHLRVVALQQLLLDERAQAAEALLDAACSTGAQLV